VTATPTTPAASPTPATTAPTPSFAFLPIAYRN
jgi:hypothetical protein